MDYNIDNEHFNATFKALGEAHALLTLPENTLKWIVKQQGEGATDGILEMLFEEADSLLRPGENRWMETGEEHDDDPWMQGANAAEWMFSELRLLSRLPTGPQHVFNLLFLKMSYNGESWVRCVVQEAPQDWYERLDDLMHHMIQQQYKQKATSPEAWNPQPWIEELQKFRAFVQAQSDYRKDAEAIFEKSLRELLD